MMTTSDVTERPIPIGRIVDGWKNVPVEEPPIIEVYG